MTTTGIVLSIVFGLMCLACAAYTIASVVEEGVRTFERSMQDHD